MLKTPDGTWFKWDPPDLPAWALPNGNGESDSEIRETIRTLLDQAAAGCHINGSETKKIEDALADVDANPADLQQTQRVLKRWITEGREAEAVA